MQNRNWGSLIKWWGREGPVSIQKFLSLGAKLFVVLVPIHQTPLKIFYFNLFDVRLFSACLSWGKPSPSINAHPYFDTDDFTLWFGSCNVWIRTPHFFINDWAMIHVLLSLFEARIWKHHPLSTANHRMMMFGLPLVQLSYPYLIQSSVTQKDKMSNFQFMRFYFHSVGVGSWELGFSPITLLSNLPIIY